MRLKMKDSEKNIEIGYHIEEYDSAMLQMK